jgi:hypothetical protein
MKKLFMIFVLLYSSIISIQATSNLITGGNMESATAWTVINYNHDAQTATFGDITHTPSQGAGGCYHISSTAGQNVQYLVYQQLTLKTNTLYT